MHKYIVCSALERSNIVNLFIEMYKCELSLLSTNIQLIVYILSLYETFLTSVKPLKRINK